MDLNQENGAIYERALKTVVLPFKVEIEDVSGTLTLKSDLPGVIAEDTTAGNTIDITLAVAETGEVVKIVKAEEPAGTLSSVTPAVSSGEMTITIDKGAALADGDSYDMHLIYVVK